MKYKILVFFLTPLLCIQCEKDFMVTGMAPIYLSYEDFSLVRSTSPKEFNDLGKISVYLNYIFINERGKGIHVINNTDPENPINEYFWQIPGNNEFTISQNVLYADNGKNLWVIDISNFAELTILQIIKNQYTLPELEVYPENYSGYFDCYRRDKGILDGWQEKELINPLCKTN